MVVLAGLTIALNLATGLPLQRAFSQRVAEFVYNRPRTHARRCRRPTLLGALAAGRRVVAFAVLAFAALGILRSVSGAAAMGLGAGLAMFVLARLLPARLAVGLAGLGLGLAVALAPVEGDLLDRFMPEAAHEAAGPFLVARPRRHRPQLRRGRRRGPMGRSGLRTSARFAETPVAARLDPEMRTLLAVGHPHNAFLQVWAELGIVGAMLAAAVLMLTLARLVAWPAEDRATALALVAAAAAIAFVEHKQPGRRGGRPASALPSPGCAMPGGVPHLTPFPGPRPGRIGPRHERDLRRRPVRDRRRLGRGPRRSDRGRLRRRVTLAEEYRVGGTCVIRGCVPKKLMVYAGRFADEFEDAAGFGWTVEAPRFDWSVMKRRRDAEVTRLEGIYDANLIRAGVTVVPERAVIEDAHTVRLVGSDRRVTAKVILVAVGAHPVKEPAVPGAELAITSNEVFELETLPERILVIAAATSRSSSRACSRPWAAGPPCSTAATVCCAASTTRSATRWATPTRSDSR